MNFQKYVLSFDRSYTMTAEGLAAKMKYAPELGDDIPTVEGHIDRCVYNPNLHIVSYLDGKIKGLDKVLLRRIVEYTRLRYFTPFDIDYASRELPVVTNHCALPIFDVDQEAVVLKYINQNNGFKNIKKKEYIENDWQKKHVTFLPEVESMYSRFLEAK